MVAAVSATSNHTSGPQRRPPGPARDGV